MPDHIEWAILDDVFNVTVTPSRRTQEPTMPTSTQLAEELTELDLSIDSLIAELVDFKNTANLVGYRQMQDAASYAITRAEDPTTRRKYRLLFTLLGSFTEDEVKVVADQIVTYFPPVMERVENVVESRLYTSAGHTHCEMCGEGYRISGLAACSRCTNGVRDVSNGYNTYRRLGENVQVVRGDPVTGIDEDTGQPTVTWRAPAWVSQDELDRRGSGW